MANEELIKKLEKLTDEIDRPGDEPIREAIDALKAADKQIDILRGRLGRHMAYITDLLSDIERAMRRPKP